MSKKAILVQILVLMFALQSVWGVAEASCLHEMTETFNTSHDDRLNKTTIDTSALDPIEAYCAKVCFQDKCGHFGHHISLENDVPKQQSIQSSWTEHKQSYHWQNSYQSLFLNLLNPPPQFPPL